MGVYSRGNVKPEAENLLCTSFVPLPFVRSGEVYRELNSKVLTPNWETEFVSFSLLSCVMDGNWREDDFVP